ncbi:kinesin-like protein KIF12 isoform X1 [Folsomia candida]|uniref:kinesin-like protein KIF12 isoform X1 n=1 Tax=Folsomia candida TaxID=158441 RepID=UPI00160544FC|nr:kinesin-like protein KIF12 isoform X1 [Folsomia candida]
MVSSRDPSPTSKTVVKRRTPLNSRSGALSPTLQPTLNGRKETFTGNSTFPNGMASSIGSATSLNTFDGDYEMDQPGGDSNHNINVVVRVRPLNEKEVKTGDDCATHFPGNGQIWLDATSPKEKPKSFTYNVVFEPEATQEDVLNHSGVKRLIDMAVDGFSCTVFCYGQTGSGKTHTLTGPPNLFQKNPDPFSPHHGLVFRSFLYLFDQIQNRNDFHFVLKASFLEIYNEKVIDLLNTSRKSLAVRWSKKSRGFFVENLFMVECEEFDDLLAVLEEGMRNRAVGRHNMNEYSSRSHTILTVHITSEQKASEEGVFISRHGKLHFVDLAGSEMTKKTQSEGKTLEEANNINKSLMVLGYCIASLSDAKKKSGHIPYRDSKLTKLLADSLAGSGVTLMIACISPAKSNMSETLNTLRYAARAKRIRTKPVVVMDPREALIVSLKREVTALREENNQLRQFIQVGRPSTGEIGNWPARNLETANGIGTVDLPDGLDKEKLDKMEPTQLVDTIAKFIQENAALRQDNWELVAVRDLLIRDQELVCRENERLLKKLEDVNSVCCRSPIAPARPSYSADMIKSQSDDEIASGMRRNGEGDENWSNYDPANKDGDSPPPKQKGSAPSTPQQVPDSISKELEKRRIGKSSMSSLSDPNKNHKRNNSWDKIGSRDSSGGSLKSGGSSDSLPTVQGKRVIPNNTTTKAPTRKRNQRSVSPATRKSERNLIV